VFEILRNNQKLTLLVISLGAFMGFLDVSIVNVSLPTMAKFFGVSTSSVFWVILIYMIVLGSFLIAFGKLAQQKGYKKVFLTGFFLFIIGSAMSGLAQHFDTLIMARFIQAVGAAMFSAITAAMVAIYLPENVRGRNMGIIATMGSLGMALGPVLGGFITQYINFHWIFYINIPIGIFAIIMGKAVFEETEIQPGKIDVFGIILIFIAQTTLIFALNKGLDFGWTSSIILGSIITSIIFWALFIFQESRTSEPLLDMNFVRIRQIALAIAGNFFFNMPYSGAVVLLPFYFELAKGFSVSQSGMALAIMPIAIMIVGPLAGILSDRIDPNRVSLIGALIGILACVLIASFNPLSSLVFIAVAFLVMGASVATFNPPNTKFVIGESPIQYRGIASGLVNTSRMMGNGFGVAILITSAVMAIFAGAMPGTIADITPDLVSAGIRNAFLIGAVIMVIALILISLTIKKQEIK
jgi:DHA2 family metal-tetracycline-proton antiporter-like MFS transporter